MRLFVVAPYVFLASVGLISSSLFAATSADEYVQSARDYIADGDARAALIELKNAGQLAPDSFDIPFLLSQIYSQQGQFLEAEHQIELALSKGLSRQIYLIWLGQYLLAQEKYVPLLKRIQAQAEDPAPVRGEVLALRTAAEIALGSRLDGQTQFEQAVQLAPRSRIANLALAQQAFESGDNNAAEKYLTLVLDQFPNDLNALYLRAQLYERRQSLKSARSTYAKILKLHPDNVASRLKHAALSLQDGKFSSAENDLQKVLAKQPELVAAKQLLAQSYWLQGRLKEAEALLQQILAVQSNQLPAIKLLAQVSAAQGKHQRAVELYKKYLAHRVAESEASMMYARLQLQMGCSLCAVEILQPSYALAPDDINLMTLLGLAYVEANQPDKGKKLLAKAAFLQPYGPHFQVRNTVQSLLQGEVEQAVSDVRNSAQADSFSGAYLIVLSLLNSDQIYAAQREAERFEQEFPAEPFATNLLGLVKLHQAQEEKAENLFERALKLDPKYVPSLLNLAEVKRQQGDFAAAEGYYLRAIKHQPELKNIRLAQARFYLLSGNQHQAVAAAQQAWKLDQGDKRAGLIEMEAQLKLQQWDQAEQIAHKLQQYHPEDLSLIKSIGFLYLRQERWSSALRTFQAVAQVLPTEPEVLEAMAYAAYQLQQRDKAWDYLQPIVQATTLQPETLVMAIELAMQRQQAQLALEWAKKLQLQLPEQAIGYEFAARIYRHLNQADQAAENYKLAYQREPTAERLIPMSQSLLALDRGPEAVLLMQQALKQDPQNYARRLSLALLLHHLGEQKAAIREYERLLDQANGDDSQVRNNLAYLYWETGHQDALKMADSAFTLAPSDAGVLDTYGWLLAQNGHLKKAKIMLTQASELRPNDAEIGFHLAWALHELGETESARAHLQHVLDNSSQFASKHQALELWGQIQSFQ